MVSIRHRTLSTEITSGQRIGASEWDDVHDVPLADQGLAEAGTDNTTLMTPLRTAQAIAAQGGGGGAGGSVAWSDVTDKPATFTPSAHSHVIADVDGLQAALDGKQVAGNYQPLATVLTNTTASFTTAQETKLAGIATGATANATDGALRDRATHTGTQPASTISDFDSATRGQVEATLVAGSGVTLTPSGSGSTRQITIAASGGSGTVTSVSGTGTVSGLSLSGTVTSSGNISLGGTLAVTPANFASQTANTFLAAPNGAAGVPTFRSLVAADVPTLNQNTTGSAATLTTSRNFSISGGGITAAAVGFNGSAAVVLNASVDAGHITLARMANLAANSIIGNNTGSTATPAALSATQVRGLLNVADGATANSSDAALRDRSTHTGTQAAGTITGLATVATSGSAADLTGNLAVARLNGGTGASASTFWRGDGTWATPAGGGGGSSFSVLNFHSDAQANATLTNQANALQGLANSNRNEAFFDASGFTEVRVCCSVMTTSASPNDPRLFPQYWDGSAWVTVGTGLAPEIVSLAAPSGPKTSDWIAIPAGGQVDTIWRIGQDGGNGAADPSLGNTSLQFR